MARRSLLLVAAFIVAALGTATVILYVQGIEARATEGQSRVDVLVATEQIDAGETVVDALAAGKIEKSSVVRADLVDGALASTSSIEDDVALGTVFPGQQIIGQQFGTNVSPETLTIPDDKLAVSVELTDPERVAGFVVPGSQVAIFVSADPQLIKPDGGTQELPTITKLLLPKVTVIGVGDTSMTARTTTDDDGQETTEQVPRTILTIAVDQGQAEKVIFGSRNGDLSFALRTERSKADPREGVTANDIMPESFR